LIQEETTVAARDKRIGARDKRIGARDRGDLFPCPTA